MNPVYNFRPATCADKASILEIWESVKGHGYCVWDKDYPTKKELEHDISEHVIYCISDGGRIVATGSVLHCAEHDSVAPWTSHVPCDLMRISTALDMQGRGLGKMMLAGLVKVSKKHGFDAMRINVAQTNEPAKKLYLGAGAVFRGEFFSYNIHWDCLELVYKPEIRLERPDDYSAVDSLVKDAFETTEVASGKEKEFISSLRKGAGFIPELSFVAEDSAGMIVGQNILTMMGDPSFGLLHLGPVSVDHSLRGEGIGARLVMRSLVEAGRKGYRGVALLGNPAYYKRFGFVEGVAFGLHFEGAADKNFLVCELYENALDGIHGTFGVRDLKI